MIFYPRVRVNLVVNTGRNILLRKVSVFTFLVVMASLISIPQAQSVTPKAGKTCMQAGVTAVANSKTFKCIRSGKKLVWSKGTETIPKSTQPTPKNKVSLEEFVKQAVELNSSADNEIPQLDTSKSVKIKKVGSNLLSNFVTANSKKSFSFLGPTPLAETSSGLTGALSLVTKDQRAVYGSQAALPPWAATFLFTTKDPQGRFMVATSGQSNQGDQNYSWRLAFKTSTSAWRYQSISGTTHATDGKKNFDEVSLGGPGSYSLRLEFDRSTTFYGIGISDKVTSISTEDTSSTLRVLILGDSWVYPVIDEAMPSHVWDAFPGALSWLTGWNVISTGVRGQGYLQQTAGEKYKNRVVRDLVPQNPDVVIFTGSPNDHCPSCSFTDQQIAKEMGIAIKSLKQANPDILIIVCSPFEGSSTQAQAMQDVAVAAGVSFIDFVNLPLFNAANNGQRQLSNGHPTRLGGSYIAAQLLKEIAALKN